MDEDEDCGPDSETGSWKSFAAMSEEQKVAATSCTVAWGKGEGERLDWEFQSRTERVDLGHLPAEGDLPCPIDADKSTWTATSRPISSNASCPTSRATEESRQALV